MVFSQSEFVHVTQDEMDVDGGNEELVVVDMASVLRGTRYCNVSHNSTTPQAWKMITCGIW